MRANEQGRGLVNCALFAIVAGMATTSPQSIRAQPLAFDVVSVKKMAGRDTPPVFDIRAIRSGRLSIRAMSVRDLIRFAYPVIRRDDQMQGGPSWLMSDRFDIDATFSPGAIPAYKAGEPLPDQLLSMLRTLLQDRFAMRARLETREVQVYALVVARRDGQLGPALRRSSTDCNSPDKKNQCGIQGGGLSEIKGVGVGIGGLLGLISRSPEIDRPVVDATELTVGFDFEFQRLIPDRGDPSVFTMVQDQYGLRLEARRSPVDILFVDNVEQPTPN